MIDTHTHMFSSKFDSDRDEAIQRAHEAGVKQLYLPNIDAHTVDDILALCSKYPGVCLPMLGLHPTSVKQDYRQQLDTLKGRLHETQWAAIGEIGTDLYWSDEFWDEQQIAFNEQCAWALEIDRPVVVHCRKSIDETLKLIKPFTDRGLRGVFHCFGGTVDQALTATSYGLYLGIGGVLTYKNNGDLSEVVKRVPREKLVLETDSPYLAPTPKRGKRNESSYLPYVLAQLANSLDLSVADTERITTANAHQLFA